MQIHASNLPHVLELSSSEYTVLTNRIAFRREMHIVPLQSVDAILQRLLIFARGMRLGYIRSSSTLQNDLLASCVLTVLQFHRRDLQPISCLVVCQNCNDANLLQYTHPL